MFLNRLWKRRNLTIPAAGRFRPESDVGEWSIQVTAQVRERWVNERFRRVPESAG
jgi:hypothetical protein